MIPVVGVFGVLVWLWGFRPWRRRPGRIEPWMSEFDFEADDVIDHRLRER